MKLFECINIFIFCVFFNYFLLLFFTKRNIFQPQRKEENKKSVIPTFGGVSFLFVFLFLSQKDFYLILLAVLIGLIGFVDDFFKVYLSTSDGVCSIHKLALEFFLVSIYIYFVPINRPWLLFNIMMQLFAVIVLVSSINAVNISDGIDSLSSFIAIFCLAFLYFKTFNVLALNLIFMLFAFLFFNFPPACLYMGDVGSLSLGTMIGGLFLKHNLEWALVFVGIVYVIETASSFLQIFSIGLFQKKIFLMAPFHHHLFLKGWSKNQVLFLFFVLTIIGGLISICFF